MNKMFLFFLVSVISFVACSEERYSCNPEVDKWVKTNLDEIQLMTRASWLTLPDDKRVAAFIAFTPLQRQKFWENRLEEVLTSDLGWTEEERVHIEKLYNKISLNLAWFEDKRSEDIKLDFDRYVFEWVDFAEEELHWSREQVAILLATADKLATKFSIAPNSSTNNKTVATRSEGGGKVDCNCNSEDNWCTTPIPKCVKNFNDCDPSDLGCGLMFSDPCDGRCTMDL